MSKRVALFLSMILMAAVCLGGVSFAQQVNQPIYRFDPALSIKGPRPPALSADPQVVIAKDDKQASLRLQTETAVSPYLGAELPPELSPEELRLLEGGKERGALADYQLEAGVGVFVEDRASFSLGYRFSEQAGLAGERSNDPLSLSGDLRIGFDVKVPF